MMKKRSSKASNIANNIKAKTNDVKRKVIKGTNNTSKRKVSKKKKMILNILIICVVAFASLMAVFFAYIIVKAPKFDPNNLKFTQMSELYDTEGNIITKMGNENRTEISYDDLPEVLIDAIIATEDSKFFQHNGFDLARFMKASMYQLVGKNGGGASTLTMQIAKNNYTSTKSKGFEGITRKFTDIYLSIFKIERKYTKKEILEFYVNDSYLGNGAYGVEQASLNYFGKSVSELNLAEASFIAGLFQSPTYYNPYNYPERAEGRRKTVLYLMQRHGYITEEEKEIAENSPITSYIKKTQTSGTYSEYQGYIDTVVEELENEYDLNPYTTPLKIYTAMNRSKQDFVNKVMNGEAWKWENENAQAGVVMTDSASGEVLAVGAGRNKNSERSYNYATMTNRQIGSTAKPIFDYGPAVEYLGWGTVNYIDDTPTTYSDGTKISNSDGGYKGRLPLYQALGLSRNVTALKTFQQVSKGAGNDKILKFASSLGITPEVDKNGKIHEAHSIGSFTGSTKKEESRNSPMTMAGAYQAFSNGGYYIKPHTIKKFVYKDTDEVVETKSAKTRVMNDSTAYIINYSLNWSATEGLAKSAAGISGVQTAAKTGTSNFDEATRKRYHLSSKAINDLWVCGYTPKQTITFWYGYDSITKGHSTTSSWSTRDKFYRNLAENLFDKDGSSFERPSSIEEVSVIRNSIPLKKALYGGVVGYFRKGTGPDETGTEQAEQLPSVSGVTSSISGNTVHLKWNGISAEDMVNLNFDDSYGTLGYDIYVKDGSGGSEVYVGTTTSTSYTHITSYSNPVYVIYTAYSNYKTNRSKGVEHKVSVTSDFDVKISNSTIEQGKTFVDNKPIIVLYNSVDVTDGATITLESGSVDTNILGTYKLTYKVTYQGKSKTVSRNVTVTATNTTSTTE
ncbi:1A family penicillin-binding protein [Clostridium sp. CAG:594]|nr:1A family penicillin-binding protein [Clostridium sp. CAG:594]